MNITFKGMQNVGAYFDNRKKDKHLDRIAIQLNNEGANQDLDDFKEFLEKHPSVNRSNFIDIEFVTSPDQVDSDQTNYDVFVNSIKLKFENKNLPVFAKINNLLKRIASGKEEIPIAEHYLTSKTCHDRFYSRVADRRVAEQFKFIEEIHEPDFVKSMANSISKSFTNAIDDYCNGDRIEYLDDFKSISGFNYGNDDFELKRIFIELNSGDSNKYKHLTEEFPLPYDQNNLVLDFKKDKGGSNPKIYLNNYRLNIEDENFNTFRDITKLLKMVSSTEKQLPLPKNYLSTEHLDMMTEGRFDLGEIDYWFAMPEEFREDNGITLKVAENRDETKELVDESIKFINKAFAKHYR